MYGFENEISFSCGNLSITSAKSLGPGYFISHNFTLSKEIKLYFDSLQIRHAGNLLNYEVVDAENGNLIIAFNEISKLKDELKAEGYEFDWQVKDGFIFYRDNVAIPDNYMPNYKKEFYNSLK